MFSLNCNAFVICKLMLVDTGDTSISNKTKILLLGSASCTLCLAGTFSTAIGATAFSACIPCPGGMFSSRQGTTSAQSCNNTATYSCDRDADCNYPPCAALTGSVSCNANPIIRPGSPANRCGWGYYTSSCPSGYSCYNAGGGTCPGISCYLGTCPDPSYTCAAGSYSWIGCVPCPAGSYSSASGATSSATCRQCSAGTFSSGSGVKHDVTRIGVVFRIQSEVSLLNQASLFIILFFK